ncbi:MAG: phosphatase PAP2 family protein [Lachnospiraceae bacterium]|nr:phosphatase PAP2 family protein [Lachnospiraceae bacterium]
MKQESYEYFAKRITGVSWGVKAIGIASKCLTYSTAALYLTALADLFFHKEYKKGFLFLVVPLFSFLIVSFFRAHAHQKRPYEIYDIKPLIPKDTREKSFPSRHIFSIYVIGVTVCFYHIFLGIFICVMGVFLAVIRVVAGVHFPRDVIWGAVIGSVCGGLVGVVLALNL